jgi:hypothetical protein
MAARRSGWISRQGESSYSNSLSSERGREGERLQPPNEGSSLHPWEKGVEGWIGCRNSDGGGVGALLELDFLLLAPKSRVGGGIGGFAGVALTYSSSIGVLIS